MKTALQSPEGFLPFSVDRVAIEGYDQLLQHAHDIGTLCGVTAAIEEKTFDLLDTLRVHDEKTAKECLQTLPLALHVGEVVGDFYGIDVDSESLWAAALLHDIGKIAVPKMVIDRSNEGKSWTDRDRRLMRVHPLAGAAIVRAHGFSESVARPVEEHHHKQLGSQNYGADPALANEERVIRDCLASADFTDAALNRTNTRNAHMSRMERELEVSAHLHFLFGDYTDASQLASHVAGRLLYLPTAA